MDYMFWCFNIVSYCAPFSRSISQSRFNCTDVSIYTVDLCVQRTHTNTGSVWCILGMENQAKKREKKTWANKIDGCQIGVKKVHALTFEAIDVENTEEMRFMYAIFFDTASSCICAHGAHSTWQVFTEAAKTNKQKKRSYKRVAHGKIRMNTPESTEQIRWMAPVSLGLIRMEKIVYNIYFYLFHLFICCVCLFVLNLQRIIFDARFVAVHAKILACLFSFLSFYVVRCGSLNWTAQQLCILLWIELHDASVFF